MSDDANDLADRICRGDRRALAQGITLIESARADHEELAQLVIERLLPRTGGALRVGLSGVPGAGKSTFIEAFGCFLIEQGRRVAVLAVDPSSARSGGSILGDKTRMPRLSVADEAFVRPSPASGALGGVARRTRETLLLCEAAGYDVVLVETVGVGQSEVSVASIVDSFVLLSLAGAGDELQGIKRGILELVDAVFVNKADGDNRPHALRAAAETKSALRLLRGSEGGWEPVVGTVSALEARGLDDVWATIQEHRAALERSGELSRKRRAQRQAWLRTLLDEGLRTWLLASPRARAAYADAERAVEADEITPTAAVRRLLASLA